MEPRQLRGLVSARKPKPTWDTRAVSYDKLVRVWVAVKEKAEPRYHYSGGTFVPSGVSVYKGSQRAITDALGLNTRYGTDAFAELAAVGCIKKLRPGVWEILRPPLRMDWLSLRSDQTKYRHHLRVLRAYVPITKQPTDRQDTPDMRSQRARRQLREPNGRFSPEQETRQPARPL